MGLVALIGLVGWSTYRSWTDGPWDLPAPPKTSEVAASAAAPSPEAHRNPASTDVIVGRNLFDPERGAGATRDAEENSRAAQRVRSMVLVGTVIIGNDKVAIVQDSTTQPAGPARAPVKSQSAVPMRLRVGDSVDGYRLAEIAERKIVFTKEAARVEVVLDYFRKTEVAPPKPTAPTPVGAPGQAVVPGGQAPAAQPQVVPNLPRRARIPVPPNQRPDS